MPHENARALLLADVVEFPGRKLGDHSSSLETDRPARFRHGIAEPNENIHEFTKAGIIRDRQPNFFRIGFQSQAFIDIHLSSAGEDATAPSQADDDIIRELKKIENVIRILIVFGDVDLRCMVVGMNLREIERIARLIRDIPGVRRSTTSIFLDETDYDSAPERWANFIRMHAARLDHLLPRPPARKRRNSSAS